MPSCTSFSFTLPTISKTQGAIPPFRFLFTRVCFPVPGIEWTIPFCELCHSHKFLPLSPPHQRSPAYVINEVINKAKANNSTNPEQPFFQRKKRPWVATLFSKKKEMPWVGFEPTTLRFLGMSALPTKLPGQLSR